MRRRRLSGFEAVDLAYLGLCSGGEVADPAAAGMGWADPVAEGCGGR